MFIEKDSHNRSQGWIEVICGSMFSGKTEELIRRLKRAKIAKLKVEIFKPGVDTRYSEEDVVSHNATALHSIPVESANEILFYANDVDVIGIDEAQFLDDELPNVCEQLANQGVRVIIAGLDMDFMGKPFGPRPHAETDGHCRGCHQGTCHLRTLRQSSAVLAPHHRRRQIGGIGRNRKLRTAVQGLLP